jgi:hypothetical protein
MPALQIVISLMACWLPLRGASLVDPIVALRMDWTPTLAFAVYLPYEHAVSSNTSS